jgi:glucosamine-6-phosphate deaminase
VHILNGNAANLEAECNAYEDAIKAVGGIDLFLAGIGDDGHIAFNEPGSSLASRTRVKTLAYDTILANSRFFGGDLNKVPRMALTVGVQTILEAREVVVIILGARKSLALQKCIEQGVNHMWTLSSLQLHPHPMLVVDEDATLELQVKTVKVSLRIISVIPKTQLTGPSSTLRASKRWPSSKASNKSFPPKFALATSRSLKPKSKRSRPLISFLPSPLLRISYARNLRADIPHALRRQTSCRIGWHRESPNPISTVD